MKYLPNLFLSLKSFFNQRQAIKTLVIRDFSERYLSSYIGLPWAFIQPSTYVFVIWFAFSYGLKSGPASPGLPFVPWLLSAMVPWLFINQTMIATCQAIPEYSYLIKKTTLNVWIIPLIKIFSGMIIHLTLMACIIMLFIVFYGIYPEIYWFQFFYYIFAQIVLLTGIAWFVSSINVLVSDMSQIVHITTTMLFWITPIIWPYSRLAGHYKYIALLNPFFYITEGYRYTFILHRWFFEYTEMNVYFWGVTTVVFIAGAFTFKRLKPAFGDIL